MYVLSYSVLKTTVLYCTVLYCTVLYALYAYTVCLYACMRSSCKVSRSVLYNKVFRSIIACHCPLRHLIYCFITFLHTPSFIPPSPYHLIPPSIHLTLTLTCSTTWRPASDNCIATPEKRDKRKKRKEKRGGEKRKGGEKEGGEERRRRETISNNKY
jgi:hypothetical protein